MGEVEISRFYMVSTLAVGIAIGIVAALAMLSYLSKINQGTISKVVNLHIESNERQQRLRIEAEILREREIRRDQAFRRLSAWLYKIETMIDDVWIACFSKELTEIMKAEKILKGWPPETFRVDPDSSASQFYWSPEINELIGEFRGNVLDLVIEVSDPISKKIEDIESHLETQEVFEIRQEMLFVINKIRKRMNEEIQR